MQSILKSLIPRSIKDWLREYFRRDSMAARESRERQIPKVALGPEHVQNCRVLLNREALLRQFPEGAVIAELGVNEGEFSDLILRSIKPSKLHLVDIWGSERYHDGLYAQVSSRFESERQSGQIEIHRQLSTEAASTFEDASFDVVYIDTCHSYEVTRDELKQYAQKVKSNGLIAGHDYSQGNWIKALRYGVIEAVHEFCVEHDWELVFLTVDPIESQSFAIRRMNPNQQSSHAQS